MALVHRVHTNFNPLLSNVYYKHIVNITRCKGYGKLNKQLNQTVKYDANLSVNYVPFEQMVTFRQNEAQRSILVKISHLSDINQCLHYIRNFGRIANVFPYRTITDQCFMLVEFTTDKIVEIFSNIAVNTFDPTHGHSTTPFFSYKYQRKYNYLSKQSSVQVYSHYLFECPSAHLISERLQSTTSVSEQMITLNDTLKFTDLDIRLRFYTANIITYYLSKLFSNMIIVPFGSSVNGFGQIGCDLDLLCKLNNIVESNTNMNNNNKTSFHLFGLSINFADRYVQKQFLESISTILKLCVPGVVSVKKILEARVPIIKFNHTNTNMQCDLSTTNIVALRMTEALYRYTEFDWRVKPLVCTIRKWAKNNNVTKNIAGHWITNFSLTLLVIFYLQTKNILPTLNLIFNPELKEQSTTSNAVRTLEAERIEFLKLKKSITHCNDESLYNLLCGFFKYYSTLDFQMFAICIRKGKLETKLFNSPLYIYNPFESGLNVSKNVTSTELIRIVDHFRDALNILLITEEKYSILKLLKLPHSQSKSKITASTLDSVKVDTMLNKNHNNNNKKNSEFKDELKELELFDHDLEKIEKRGIK